jgi:hypothetical protein
MGRGGSWEEQALALVCVLACCDLFTYGQLGGADCVAQPDQSAYEALGWDFVNVWKMGSDGYPVLRGKVAVGREVSRHCER